MSLCLRVRNLFSCSATTQQQELRKFVVNTQTLTNDSATKFPSNRIKTSRYTIITFLPKNLIEQFSRLANFYFLVIGLIQLFTDSPVPVSASVFPLVFVLSVTACKQAYEDLLRHRSDRIINNTSVSTLRNGRLECIAACDIRVGDILKVHKNESFPCDLLLLSSSEESGQCAITTANLDGETSLKTILPIEQTKRINNPSHLSQHLKAVIECEHPNSDLYKFVGSFTSDNIITPISQQNLLLRGAILKNTDFIFGCTVYTGPETKMQLNSKDQVTKKSIVEKRLDRFILLFMILLLIAAVFCTIMKWMSIYHDIGIKFAWYLSKEQPTPLRIIQDLLGFLVLFNYLIPISLYVTIEFQKFFGTTFFNSDLEITYQNEETGEVFPAKANTSDLNEELGQVEYLFCDKTGTLTENLMAFRGCAILGTLYRDLNGELWRIDGETLQSRITSFNKEEELFFTILALCHTVRIESVDNCSFKSKKKHYTEQEATMYSYEASSPDEKVLVESARNFGIIFHGSNESDETILTIFGNRKRFKLLQTLDFDSDRKRMSVIIKNLETGEIFLFTKGAESSVLERCNTGCRDVIMKFCEEFSGSGLRVLVCAYRKLSLDDYEKMKCSLEEADRDILNRDFKRASVYDLIEDGLIGLGCTGVEDRLQEGVVDTLTCMREAGILVWVLTGDKMETAENVCMSAGHLTEAMQRFRIKEHNLDSQLNTLPSSLGYYCILIDGPALSKILDNTELTDKFMSLCRQAASVLCARCTPLQKAQVVKMVKKGVKPTPITCAIGDGANDVSMIREAHVGLGLYGKEGRSAALNADFAFARFHFLRKALLFHGHLYYIRLATMVQYFFYKNVAFITAEFFYAFYSGFSAQTPFHAFFLTIYNIFMTSLPVLLYGLFEQQVDRSKLLYEPRLYKTIAGNSRLSWQELLKWSTLGLWHCLCCYFGVHFIFTYNDDVSLFPNTLGVFCFGFIIIQCIMVVVNMKLLLETYYFTWATVVGLLVTAIGNITLWIIYNVIPVTLFDKYLYLYFAYFVILSQPATWLMLICLTALSLVPDLIMRSLRDSALCPRTNCAINRNSIPYRKKSEISRSGIESQRLSLSETQITTSLI